MSEENLCLAKERDALLAKASTLSERLNASSAPSQWQVLPPQTASPGPRPNHTAHTADKGIQADATVRDPTAQAARRLAEEAAGAAAELRSLHEAFAAQIILEPRSAAAEQAGLVAGPGAVSFFSDRAVPVQSTPAGPAPASAGLPQGREGGDFAQAGSGRAVPLCTSGADGDSGAGPSRGGEAYLMADDQPPAAGRRPDSVPSPRSVDAAAAGLLGRVAAARACAGRLVEEAGGAAVELRALAEELASADADIEVHPSSDSSLPIRVLCLGPTSAASSAPHQFALANLRWKIYEKSPTAAEQCIEISFDAAKFGYQPAAVGLDRCVGRQASAAAFLARTKRGVSARLQRGGPGAQADGDASVEALELSAVVHALRMRNAALTVELGRARADAEEARRLARRAQQRCFARPP